MTSNDLLTTKNHNIVPLNSVCPHIYQVYLFFTWELKGFTNIADLDLCLALIWTLTFTQSTGFVYSSNSIKLNPHTKYEAHQTFTRFTTVTSLVSTNHVWVNSSTKGMYIQGTNFIQASVLQGIVFTVYMVCRIWPRAIDRMWPFTSTNSHSNLIFTHLWIYIPSMNFIQGLPSLILWVTMLKNWISSDFKQHLISL